MAIAEPGGPTTQAGISYQNTIAAIYLGQMLDPKYLNASEQIVEVRVEAPELVDDIVVTFANGTKRYIQAKESVSKANARTSPWGKLWKDFEDQFNSASFNRGVDKLQLWSGLHKEEIIQARDLSVRASTSKTFDEWRGRLSQNLTSLLDHLKTFLSPELRNDKDKLLSFFSSVEVEVDPRWFIEEKVILHSMPESNLSASALFTLLVGLISGKARVRESYTVKNLQKWLHENQVVISASTPIEELRSAIYSSSSILRHKNNTIGTIRKHLSRNASKEISKWLLETTDKEPIGVLLDQAGTGKTVVMQEILEELERQQVDVLAIKADLQLSGAQSPDNLQAKLDLPVRVERIAGILASEKPFVVLIDQIDALSLSMAHDQCAMDLALNLIYRLHSIPGVRILISCRKFDFNSDPRLKNLEGCKSFHLQEFSEEEIKEFLDSVGLDYDLLLPSTQKLLRTPLHLNLFVMAYESVENKTLFEDRGFTSLQELYHFVWEQVIMKQHPEAPASWERKQALSLMAAYMDREQKIVVPKSYFTQEETSHFERSIQWLSSEGIVMAEERELSFFHQTFFDYCYARDFVEKGRSLVDFILASPQGLFQRPQLVQVLSYMRGLSDQKSYLKQLNALLNANHLRYHLKNHLYRWFAAIPSLTEHEWRIVKRLTQDLGVRSQLMRFSSGNPGWFEFWRDTALPDLLNGGDNEGYEEAFRYLHSVIESRQKDVIKFLQPYYEKGQPMQQIVGNLIQQIRTWKCPEAVDMLETVLGKVSLDNRFSYYGWAELAQYDPEAVCRILRFFMDQALVNFKRKKQEKENDKDQPGSYEFYFISLKLEMNRLDSTDLEKALGLVIENSPLYFLEMFIPWLIMAVQAESYSEIETSEHFIFDRMFHSWYDRFHIELDDVMKDFWVNAFVRLAHEEPHAFVEKIEYLSDYPYESIQFLVARVLREVPESYTSTAFQFLLNDPRRLTIGEHDDFESRQLIKSIFPYLQETERRELEDSILNDVPCNIRFKMDGYRYHDLRQLGLLQAIPNGNLSKKGEQRLLELERKFPGYRASDNPRQSEGGIVGSPINTEAANKMSDQQWLSAMQKYKGRVTHPDWFMGGASELSRVLQELVKQQPHRFASLFSHCNYQLDQHYVCALLNGLADSDSSADLLFQAIDRCKLYEDWEVRRTIAWAVEKRANEDVPKQIIALLKTYLDDLLMTEYSYDKEPFSGYLNTVRGAAMNALMRVYSENDEIHLYERWAILCYAVQSDNISLRAGAIRELLFMIRYDRQRAIDLFEQAIEQYPQLYEMPYTGDFCYWAMGKPFQRLIPHLVQLMNNEKEQIQQRGAELVAISLISRDLFENQSVREEMEALLEIAFVGHAPHRRGVARVFSNNLLSLPDPNLITGLHRFMNDEDDEVQRLVGSFLYDIKKNDRQVSGDVRTFILDFATSSSVLKSGHPLGSVLWEQSVKHPEWTLSVIQRLLNNDYFRSATDWNRIDSQDLFRAIMNIYTDPDPLSEHLQTEVMDTFDSLMELYSVQAQILLAEWDRR